MTDTTQTSEIPQIPAPAQSQAPAPRHWAEDRVSELTALKYKLEEENRQLKERIPQEKKITLTPQELQAVVAQQSENISFNKDSNAVFEKGVKEFEDFQPTLQALHGVGNFGPATIQATFEIERELGVPAHKIIYELGKNPAKAKEILGKSPIAAAAALSKFASGIGETKPKKQSSAPDPITPVADTPTVDGSADPANMDTARWMEWRTKNKKSRR